MPPRPFPFPINVGTDICSIQRIFGILTSRSTNPDRFLRKVLNQNERDALRQDGAIRRPLREFWEVRKKSEWLKIHMKAREESGGSENKGTEEELKAPGYGNILKELGREQSLAELLDLERNNNMVIAGGSGSELGTERMEWMEVKRGTENSSRVETGFDNWKLSTGTADEESISANQATLDKGTGDKFYPQLDVRESDKAQGLVDVEQEWNHRQKEKVQMMSLKVKLDAELNQIQSAVHSAAQWLAGRFAAKEAVIKAHRSRDLTFHDIWIYSPEKSTGRSAPPETRVIAEDGSWEDYQIVPVSISHDGDYATAVCLAPDSSVIEENKVD